MQQSSSKKAAHLYEIDILRFLAAIAVVLGHYVYVFDKLMHIVPSPYPFVDPLRYVYPVIEIFFMISGYIVFRTAITKTVQEFVISRIVRIYPVFWICCTIFFIGLYFGGSMEGAPKASLSNYLYNMTMLHEFFGKPALNPAFWTLTYELSFYFIICLIIAFRLWDNILLVIAVWLGYTLLVGPLSANNAFAYILIPRYSPCFIAGMLFALIQRKESAPWKLYSLMALTLVASLRSANASRHIMEGVGHVTINPYIIYGITTSFYVLMFLIVFRVINLSRFAKWSVLGVLAYPLYLIHNLGAGVYYYLGGTVNKYILLFGTIAFMLVLSWLIHLVGDRAFAKWLTPQLKKLFAKLSKSPTSAEKTYLNEPEIVR
jgi:peptidoglycan/LPS O-acetylase OafA/YrhL